jgi:hypothetical protein
MIFIPHRAAAIVFSFVEFKSSYIFLGDFADMGCVEQ